MPLEQQDLEQFLANARIKLPGASEAGLKIELFDVYKEFFKDTNSWVEDINFTPVAATQSYRIVPRGDGTIIRLVGVWDSKLIPIPAYMPHFGTIQLPHPPQATGSSTPWFARVIKNVVLPTTKDMIPVVPDWTLRVHEDVILDGLLGRMMSQKDKSYSDKTQAVYHLRRFRTGITNVRTQAIRQNLMGAQEWSYPQGFAKGSQRGGVSTAWPSRAF